MRARRYRGKASRRRSRGPFPLLAGLLAALALCLYILLPQPEIPSYTLEDLPAYNGVPAVPLYDDRPDFPDTDKTSQAFERYSQLDYLGRCGPAYANVGPETMPIGEREPIGMIRPSGWQTTKYDFVDGKYLYNRCHLMGWQLTGENANELNLITGTRYMNVEGMLPYENQVAGYVKETGNHVLYRVTPIYSGADLVARGVEMEALSVEDGGRGVRFHVYAYNVQPGVEVDYASGLNWPEGERPPAPDPTPEEAVSYVLNTGSMRFHLPACPGVRDVKPENRQEFTGSRQDLLGRGYQPCGTCRP